MSTELGIDGDTLRSVVGRFATGVTAVCARVDGRPVGMAVNSFTSVSLEPPLVVFCAAKTSATWTEMEASGRFAVSILAAGQGDLCRQLSRKGVDRFDGVALESAPSGSPLIAGCLAWLDCRTVACHDAGDHILVIGHVDGVGVSEAVDPLVFYASQFVGLAP